MSTVWMQHPDLGDDQLIQVDERQAPHYAAAGWAKTDPPAPVPHPLAVRRGTATPPETPVPAVESAAAADPSAPETESDTDSPKRRRSTPQKEATTP